MASNLVLKSKFYNVIKVIIIIIIMQLLSM